MSTNNTTAIMNILKSQQLTQDDVNEIIKLIPIKPGRLPTKYSGIVKSVRQVIKNMALEQVVAQPNIVAVAKPAAKKAKKTNQKTVETWSQPTIISAMSEKSFLGLSKSNYGRVSLRVFVVTPSGIFPTKNGLTLSSEDSALVKAAL